MEVFVVIVLLFGAFSLGSATHSDVDADQATVEVPAAMNESTAGSGEVHVDEMFDHTPLQDCMTNRHVVIYRDLTRANVRKLDAATKTPGNCDGVCVDE